MEGNQSQHYVVNVIAHYAQPSKKQQCLEELRFFTKNVRRDHPNIPLVVAGDLNMPPQEAATFLESLGLTASKPEGEE